MQNAARKMKNGKGGKGMKGGGEGRGATACLVWSGLLFLNYVSNSLVSLFVFLLPFPTLRCIVWLGTSIRKEVK